MVIQLVDKLRVRPPDQGLIRAYLDEIAAAYQVSSWAQKPTNVVHKEKQEEIVMLQF